MSKDNICAATCKLFGYNKVHNFGQCYTSAPFCAQWLEEDERRFVDDLTILDVPDPPEDDDDAIEDPSLP